MATVSEVDRKRSATAASVAPDFAKKVKNRNVCYNNGGQSVLEYPSNDLISERISEKGGDVPPCWKLDFLSALDATREEKEFVFEGQFDDQMFFNSTPTPCLGGGCSDARKVWMKILPSTPDGKDKCQLTLPFDNTFDQIKNVYCALAPRVDTNLYAYYEMLNIEIPANRIQICECYWPKSLQEMAHRSCKGLHISEKTIISGPTLNKMLILGNRSPNKIRKMPETKSTEEDVEILQLLIQLPSPYKYSSKNEHGITIVKNDESTCMLAEDRSKHSGDAFYFIALRGDCGYTIDLPKEGQALYLIYDIHLRKIKWEGMPSVPAREISVAHSAKEWSTNPKLQPIQYIPLCGKGYTENALSFHALDLRDKLKVNALINARDEESGEPLLHVALARIVCKQNGWTEQECPSHFSWRQNDINRERIVSEEYDIYKMVVYDEKSTPTYERRINKKKPVLPPNSHLDLVKDVLAYNAEWYDDIIGLKPDREGNSGYGKVQHIYNRFFVLVWPRKFPDYEACKESDKEAAQRQNTTKVLHNLLYNTWSRMKVAARDSSK
jgi:hypothetical protein